jgi:hypothetical protein
MRTGDVSGDGHADIVMVGEEGALTVVDGVTFAARGEMSATPHAGLALVDVEGDATAEIIVGKDDGSVQVLRASDFSVIRTLKPCSESVLALQAATLPGNTRGDVFYACGDGVGLMNLRIGGTARRLTGVIGGAAGIGNLLWARGTAEAPRITVSTISGLRFLGPSAPVAPYVLPWRSATPQFFVTPWRTPITDDITLGNFTGRPATLELLEGPGSGTFQLGSSASFTYAPARPGLQHFTVRATDGLATSVPVTLSIYAGNGTPSPYAQSDFNVTRGVAYNGTLNGMDPDGDAVQFQLVSSPTQGTLTLAADGRFTYTSNSGAAGDDSFTYIASDTFAESPVASVVLHIQEPVTTTPPPATPPPQTPPSSSPPPKSGGGGGGLEWLTLLALLLVLAQRRIATRKVPSTAAFW